MQSSLRWQVVSARVDLERKEAIIRRLTGIVGAANHVRGD